MNSLWDILGEGEVKSLAQLSTDHWNQHTRPLRVAIDEAGWRFHNLSDAQVAAIRQKVPEANPIEKAILWRVLKLMRMNIQPIFIFDGPSRPWKRGGVAGRIDWKKIDLLRKMLNHLKIPHHRAPAEAEAECARLNELGIVDAVWTDDGDAFMFGAKMLIKEHREGKSAKKSDSLVRVYRADEIERKHRINRQGLVLFALLSGGDYDTKGLPGCGPTAALAAAQFDNGRLGEILCETPLRQLHCFTESLRTYFQMPGTQNVYVPPGYPRDLHVKNYREPKVSTLERATNLRGLKDGWYVPIDEDKLRKFLLPMFNMDTKAYLKHIVPLLLVKELVNTTPETVDKNLVFDLQLVQKRGRDYDAECLERQITFDPKKCTELNLWKKPDNEDWKEDFDPTAPVEAEFLEYILVNALGRTEMDRLKQLANQPKPRKRKTNDATAEDTGSQTAAETTGSVPIAAAKRQKKATTAQPPAEASASTQKATSKTTTKPKPTKRHGKTTQPAEEPKPVEAPAAAVRKGFQLPRALVRNPSMLSEFASQSSQDILFRSASFQSFDSEESSHLHPTPRGTFETQLSGDRSQQSREIVSLSVAGLRNPQSATKSHRAVREKHSAAEEASTSIPPSSQLDPAASSWTFESLSPIITLDDETSPNNPSAKAPNQQQTRPPIFNEETPPPEPTPVPPSNRVPTTTYTRPPPPQSSIPGRGCVVVDLDSDDDDVLPVASGPVPARPGPATASPRHTPYIQAPCAPALPEEVVPAPVIATSVSAAIDSRQAIAAARLKHFEKKAPETIDLTLDD